MGDFQTTSGSKGLTQPDRSAVNLYDSLSMTIVKVIVPYDASSADINLYPEEVLVKD